MGGWRTQSSVNCAAKRRTEAGEVEGRQVTEGLQCGHLLAAQDTAGTKERKIMRAVVNTHPLFTICFLCTHELIYSSQQPYKMGIILPLIFRSRC